MLKEEKIDTNGNSKESTSLKMLLLYYEKDFNTGCSGGGAFRVLVKEKCFGGA